MKEWEKESFIALFLIHNYPCLPGIIRLFIALNDISTDEATKTNRQTIEKTNMTQPAELDWSCHETTIWLSYTLK